MSGKRFFVNKISDGRAVVSGGDFHHITAVLRKKTGDKVVIFNYEHGEFEARIEDIIKKNNTLIIVVEKKIRERENFKNIIRAYISVVKNESMNFIIEKMTELGVDEINPVITRRCAIKLKDTGKKARRWEKIAYSAVKQSGRLSFPCMNPVITGVENLKDPEAGEKRFLVWEKEENKFLIDEIMKLPENKDKVSFFIGPEGGFEDDEASLLAAKGFEPVSIGHNVLRVETAAVLAGGVITQILRRNKWKK
ncbi:MAG: RsmE family RNA methyltransferase [bacterium]